MSKPKLTYFDAAGRAFALRVSLFGAFGKDGWDDNRIKYDDWAELKPKTPLGSVPVFTLADGTEIVQTDSIQRWAARQAGLYPEDLNASLLCDSITCTCFEALNKGPPSSDKEGRENYAAGFLTQVCTYLEGKLQNEQWVLGGDSLTLADLMVFTVSDMILTDDWTHIPASFLNGFPKMKEHNERVKKNALVAKYLTEYSS
mmetsp:Transcript_58830/g.93042  ORF Transcript_58830/g.93042 Transcript_58830/m.93042 type:complete len:201 (-) Transcript_58830:6-608(-)